MSLSIESCLKLNTHIFHQCLKVGMTQILLPNLSFCSCCVCLFSYNVKLLLFSKGGRAEDCLGVVLFHEFYIQVVAGFNVLNTTWNLNLTNWKSKLDHKMNQHIVNLQRSYGFTMNLSLDSAFQEKELAREQGKAAPQQK